MISISTPSAPFRSLTRTPFKALCLPKPALRRRNLKHINRGFRRSLSRKRLGRRRSLCHRHPCLVPPTATATPTAPAPASAAIRTGSRFPKLIAGNLGRHRRRRHKRALGHYRHICPVPIHPRRIRPLTPVRAVASRRSIRVEAPVSPVTPAAPIPLAAALPFRRTCTHHRSSRVQAGDCIRKQICVGRLSRCTLRQPRLFRTIPPTAVAATIPTTFTPATALTPARAAAFTLAARRALTPAAPIRVRLEVSRFAGFLHKISDIQERIAFQPDIHKRALHTRQHTRYLAVVDRSGQRIFVFALIVHLGEGVIFNDGKPRLMRRRRDINFLRHCSALFFPSDCLSGPGGQAKRESSGSHTQLHSELSAAHHGARPIQRCGSRSHVFCCEVLAHFGPGLRSQRSRHRGKTVQSIAERGCFKHRNAETEGDQFNLNLRRGRLPSRCVHSENLSGQRSSNLKPGRPLLISFSKNQSLVALPLAPGAVGKG